MNITQFRTLVARTKSGVDILDVVGRRMQIDSEGKGVCPFHNDSWESFSVDRAQQSFQCSECGVSGDALLFIQLFEGKTIWSALHDHDPLHQTEIWNGTDLEGADTDQVCQQTGTATLIDNPEGRLNYSEFISARDVTLYTPAPQEDLFLFLSQFVIDSSMTVTAARKPMWVVDVNLHTFDAIFTIHLGQIPEFRFCDEIDQWVERLSKAIYKKLKGYKTVLGAHGELVQVGHLSLGDGNASADNPNSRADRAATELAIELFKTKKRLNSKSKFESRTTPYDRITISV